MDTHPEVSANPLIENQGIDQDALTAALEQAIAEEMEVILHEDRVKLAAAIQTLLQACPLPHMVELEMKRALHMSMPGTCKKDLQSIITREASQRIEEQRKALRAPLIKFLNNLTDGLQILAAVKESFGLLPVTTAEESDLPRSSEDPQKADADKERTLNCPVSVLDLSVRARKALFRANANTLRDLVQVSEDDLLTIRQFGQISLQEVKNQLSSLGLSLKKKGTAEKQNIVP